MIPTMTLLMLVVLVIYRMLSYRIVLLVQIDEIIYVVVRMSHLLGGGVQ